MSCHEKAFTLIELLIVVAIIAILAAIAVPNFLEAQTRSKLSRCQADMRTYTLAIEAYRVDQNAYPPVTGVPTDPGWHTTGPRPQLTTPVAYMTSTPRDVFQGFTHTLPEYSSYYYWREPQGAATTTMLLGDAPNARIRYLGMTPRLAQWFLMGVGPDEVYGFDKYRNWNNEVIYDPTNGTISEGEMLRTGP